MRGGAASDVSTTAISMIRIGRISVGGIEATCAIQRDMAGVEVHRATASNVSATTAISERRRIPYIRRDLAGVEVHSANGSNVCATAIFRTIIRKDLAGVEVHGTAVSNVCATAKSLIQIIPPIPIIFCRSYTIRSDEA